MRKYLFLCLILAASMLFAASGCGSAESSDSVNVPSEPVKPTTAAVETSIVTTAEPSTEAPTEPTTADSSELFAYYDDLAAEWEKTGDTTPYELSLPSFQLLGIYNGNAYIYASYCLNIPSTEHKIFTVDKDNVGKEIIDLDSINGKGNFTLRFCNGYTYVMDSDNRLHEFDPSGGQVNSVTFDQPSYMSLIGVSPAGDVIITDSYNHVWNLYCLSDHLSKMRQFSKPKYEVEHGLTEEYDMLGLLPNQFTGPAYGHKLYGIGNLYLDCETLEWVNYEDGGSISTSMVRDKSYSSVLKTGSIRCVGKYCLTSKGIYDLETDKWLVVFGGGDVPEFNSGKSFVYFPKTYHGGTSNIERVAQGVSVQQYPSDGSQPVELKKYDVKLIDEYSQIILDDERYIVCDKYGIFVHTFEKGESEEIQAILFD